MPVTTRAERVSSEAPPRCQSSRSPTTSTREPSTRAIASAPIASCAHSRAAWLRNACGRRRNKASVTARTCSRNRLADMPREFVMRDRAREHLRKQHPADAGRRAVNPPQPRRGRQLRRAESAHERDIGARDQRRGSLGVVGRVQERVGRKLRPQPSPRPPRDRPHRERAVNADEDVHARRLRGSAPGAAPAVRGRSRRWRRRASRPAAISPIDHRAIDGLHHVVDRQRRDGDGGQRFHLDAGPIGRADAALDDVAAAVRRQDDVDVADSGSGWHSGISADVRFAAMMPASRAVCSGSPFFTRPARTSRSAARRHA